MTLSASGGPETSYDVMPRTVQISGARGNNRLASINIPAIKVFGGLGQKRDLGPFFVFKVLRAPQERFQYHYHCTLSVVEFKLLLLPVKYKDITSHYHYEVVCNVLVIRSSDIIMF